MTKTSLALSYRHST